MEESIMVMLKDGRNLEIENGGDAICFRLYDENGEFKKEAYWDSDFIVDTVFE